MDLTLPIIGVIGYVAYTLAEKEVRKARELRKTKSKTVGENIYQSDDLRKNTKYVQDLADSRYAKSKNTKETKIVPNFFNNSCQIIDCNANENSLRQRKKLSDFPSTEKKENFSELAGGKVDISKHNNMQPFFRGSSTGTRKTEDADIIGLYTGNQRTYKTKEESESFFKPISQNINGLNTIVEDASRYVGSIYKNGEKPIEEQRVRHINEADLRPVFKTLDQLRIDPKQSYKAVFKTGQLGSERGLVGEFAKNRPDTYYENSEARYVVDGATLRSITNQNFREVGKDEFSENPQQLSQVFSSDKLKQKNRVSKHYGEGVSSVLKEDTRNTDKTFGIPNAVSGIKKPVNNTTNGMRETCRVEIESYISSAGTSTTDRIRPNGVSSSADRENYSDLKDYTFKKPVGAIKAPEGSKIVQKMKNDDNQTKFGGLRISRISEGTVEQGLSGQSVIRTREKPTNSRFLQDVQNLPANDLIKKFS
jgi:hypothetical protein